MTEKALVKNAKYLWGLSLKESIIVVFFGVLIALSTSLFEIPMNIPGHKGIVWMGILTTCVLLFKNGRAGTLAGIISGFLVVILFPSRDGALEFFKYFVPGFTMDMVFLVFPFLLKRWYTVAILASLSHIMKLAVNLVNGLILHLPLGFLTLGLKIAVIYHILFGFLGGFIGYIISKKISKYIKTNNI